MARVVVLNGGSSSGKSTLASAFRDERAAVGDFWLLIGIDEYLVKLPAAWFATGEHAGPFSDDGMTVTFGSSGADISFGPMARGVVNAYQGAVAAAAHAGLQVVVDELVFDRVAWESWQVALAGLDVVWVGVRCTLEVAEIRETARGDRTPGKARHSASFAHAHSRYDFTIDTTGLTPAGAVDELLSGLGLERRPGYGALMTQASLPGEYVPSTSAWVREQIEEYESSGGTRGTTLRDTGLPCIVVTHRGRSGAVRKIALMRVEHEGRYALVASMGGAPTNPAWYENLVANPDEVLLQDGPAVTAVRTREVDGVEREQWWARAVEAFPPYAEYQQRTERRIPVLVTEPR